MKAWSWPGKGRDEARPAPGVAAALASNNNSSRGWLCWRQRQARWLGWHRLPPPGTVRCGAVRAWQSQQRQQSADVAASHGKPGKGGGRITLRLRVVLELGRN